MTAHYIEIKKEQVSKLINAAYDLSVPVGMGFLHYEDGKLPEDDLQDLMSIFEHNLANQDPSVDYAAEILFMDYLFGRQVKLGIYLHHGKIVIQNEWRDHTAEQFAELLKRIGD